MSVTKSSATLVAALIVVLAFLAGTGVASTHTIGGACAGARTVPVDDGTRLKARAAVLCLLNRVRAAHGRPAVRLSSRLATAATRHSDEMVARKYFSHDGIRGDTFVDRARAAGYRATSELSETLAWGEAAAPERLARTLMESPSHKRIVLARGPRLVGIGLSLGAPVGGVTSHSSTLVLAFG